MNKAYVALGTNIEPRNVHLTSALGLLVSNGPVSVVKRSSIYETAPVGYTDQADFLNMVIEVETSLSSIELLNYCQSIELQLGRKRDIRFGPRTIDLDILLYNQENSTMERLIIPHPRMHERAFVLIPLYEIAPDALIPGFNKRVADFIEELPETEIKDVAKWTQERIGRRIKAFRKLKGYTQIEFAKQLGVSMAVMGDIERGNKAATAEFIEQVSEKLHIPKEEITLEESEKS